MAEFTFVSENVNFGGPGRSTAAAPTPTSAPPAAQYKKIRFGACAPDQKNGSLNARSLASDVRLAQLKISAAQRVSIDSMYALDASNSFPTPPIVDYIFSTDVDAQLQASAVMAQHALDVGARDDLGNRWSTQWSERGKENTNIMRILYLCSCGYDHTKRCASLDVDSRAFPKGKDPVSASRPPRTGMAAPGPGPGPGHGVRLRTQRRRGHGHVPDARRPHPCRPEHRTRILPALPRAHFAGVHSNDALLHPRPRSQHLYPHLHRSRLRARPARARAHDDVLSSWGAESVSIPPSISPAPASSAFDTSTIVSAARAVAQAFLTAPPSTAPGAVLSTPSLLRGILHEQTTCAGGLIALLAARGDAAVGTPRADEVNFPRWRCAMGLERGGRGAWCVPRTRWLAEFAHAAPSPSPEPVSHRSLKPQTVLKRTSARYGAER
ncbi:hypothetical protein FB451DRAFT_1437056 [Mycena latifolia]|nr:hypothetical protein FB451DRAFT_1437056 [Mycena latifolia]